jgi:hypothetical protein
MVSIEGSQNKFWGGFDASTPQLLNLPEYTSNRIKPSWILPFRLEAASGFAIG